jgi:CHAD domain-containing protein
MKPMNKLPEISTDDFLLRYYQKRSASFLLNIYNACITATENDIHKARVDLKKIYALLSFFDMLGLKPFNSKSTQKIFKEVFAASGKIREIQMNLLYLENLEETDTEIQLYSEYLKILYKKKTKRFIQSIIRFDEKEFKQIRVSLRQNCRNIKIEKIVNKCDDYFRLHSARISKYRSGSEDIVNVHKIRKEMKTISAIAKLLKYLYVDEFLEKLISEVDKTEVIIGEWHDRVILRDSLQSFMEKAKMKSAWKFIILEKIKADLDKEIDYQLAKLLPEADNVVNIIAQATLLRKA